MLYSTLYWKKIVLCIHWTFCVILFTLRFFPTYLYPKDHIQGDLFSSQNWRNKIFCNICSRNYFFYDPHNFKYSHFNIFFYFIIPYVIRKNISSIVFMF